MPTLVLLAGPNGAGKTTFINGFLRERAEAFRFVNPDEVARGLGGAGAARDLMAGRRVLERLDELVAERADFVLETTLATRSHAVRVRERKAAGYRFDLIYLSLPSPSSSSGKPRLRGADRGTQRRARARTCRGHISPEQIAFGAAASPGLRCAAPEDDERQGPAKLGTAMNKSIFDHETILKASRRAADMAKNGTREEQSGKFLPPPGWKGRLITGAPGELDDLKRKTPGEAA